MKNIEAKHLQIGDIINTCYEQRCTVKSILHADHKQIFMLVLLDTRSQSLLTTRSYPLARCVQVEQ
jgi:hypothetical protein